MLLRENHRHTGMDLRYELIRLACDNRASAQPLPRFGIFPVFPEPGKGERAAVFHGDRERQLRFSRFTPFVESVRRNQAAPFCESLPERGRFIDGLSSRIDSPLPARKTESTRCQGCSGTGIPCASESLETQA